jgi:hypothetical protein
MAIKVIARHAGLVARRRRSLPLQVLEQPPEHLGIVGDLAQLWLPIAGTQDPNHQLALPVVDGHSR